MSSLLFESHPNQRQLAPMAAILDGSGSESSGSEGEKCNVGKVRVKKYRNKMKAKSKPYGKRANDRQSSKKKVKDYSKQHRNRKSKCDKDVVDDIGGSESGSKKKKDDKKANLDSLTLSGNIVPSTQMTITIVEENKRKHYIT